MYMSLGEKHYSASHSSKEIHVYGGKPVANCVTDGRDAEWNKDREVNLGFDNLQVIGHFDNYPFSTQLW